MVGETPGGHGGPPLRAMLGGQYAGFVSRAAAFLIDRLIVVVIVSLVTAGVGFAVQGFRLSQVLGLPDVGQEIVGIGLAVFAATFDFFYDVGFWLLAGQTPGKRLLGLLIVKTDGQRIGPVSAVVRWLGYWLSGILFLGYLWVLIDNRRQAWHDKLASTLVVYVRSGER